MTLNLQSSHARQLHIKNEASGIRHLVGPDKLLCRPEYFHAKAFRAYDSRYRPTHRFIGPYDRDEWNFFQAISMSTDKIHGNSGQIH